jgi:hypothetical protein
MRGVMGLTYKFVAHPYRYPSVALILAMALVALFPETPF